MRQLVPFAVLLLTVSAVASALRPAGPLAADSPAPMATSSARAMWVDPNGQTLLLVERSADGIEQVELQALAESGQVAWRRELGSGWLSALAEGQGQLFVAIASESRAGLASRVLGLDPAEGQLLWSLRVEGEVSDLLVDAGGGLRARSLRSEAWGGTTEHVLGIHAGVLRWQHPLEP